MSWTQRVCREETSSLLNTKESVQAETRMSPGLTGQYDWELREKAGMHQPPPPPERMGIEGEYDELGLVKRVAEAFDREPGIDDIETLYLAQDGSTIVLKGSVPSQPILSKMIDVASKVDGTKVVDITQVTIAAELLEC